MRAFVAELKRSDRRRRRLRLAAFAVWIGSALSLSWELGWLVWPVSAVMIVSFVAMFALGPEAADRPISEDSAGVDAGG